jgi:hypothetical protein
LYSIYVGQSNYPHATVGGSISSLNFSQSPSAAAGSLDFGDVDLAHFHHRCEGALGFRAPLQPLGQHR